MALQVNDLTVNGTLVTPSGTIDALLPSQTGNSGKVLQTNGSVASWQASGGSGTVTSVSVTTANGVSGTVATATTTPAITLALGAITPSSVAAVGTVTGSNLSGTNTGDQTITLTGDVTGAGTGSFATTIGATKVTNGMLAGSIAASKLTGTDIDTVGTVTSGTWSAGTIAINKGGTGQTSAANAINALVPTQSGHTGEFLKTDGSVVSWATAGGGGATIGAGSYGSLPAAGTAGNLYISTNSPLVLRDTGSSWQQFGPLFGPFTKPVTTDFPTQIGWIASTSQTANNGCVRFKDTGGQGNTQNYSCCLKTVGSTWVMTIAAQVDTATNAYPQWGIILRDSGSSKFVSFGIEYRPQESRQSLCILLWTNPTSYAGSTAAQTNVNLNGMYMYQVECDGTNLYFRQSSNFVDWVLWRTVALSGYYITSVDGVGYGISNYGGNATETLALNIYHAVCT